MTALIRAAADLQAVCEARGWRYCFIGGIAVLRWGEPRETIDVDLTLLTGFTGDDSYLLLAATDEILITDPRYTEQVQGECPGLDMAVRRPGVTIMEVVVKTIARAKLSQLGIEGDSMTVSQRDAIAEKLSKVELQKTKGLVESGKAPSRGTRRAVGLKPVRPQSAAGIRTEPPVSVPIAAAAMPSLTETAAPDDEPPGMRPAARSNGFSGVP